MKIIHLFVAAVLLIIGLAGCGNKQADRTDNELSVTAADAAANAEQVAGQKPYVVDFYATWCGPCKQLKPVFRQLEQRYGSQADFASVDVDEQQELATRLRIDVVPTIIIFSDSSMSKELARVQGFSPQQLERAILDNI